MASDPAALEPLPLLALAARGHEVRLLLPETLAGVDPPTGPGPAPPGPGVGEGFSELVVEWLRASPWRPDLVHGLGSRLAPLSARLRSCEDPGLRACPALLGPPAAGIRARAARREPRSGRARTPGESRSPGGQPHRSARKRALQQACGLPASARTPLFAVLSPLDEEHGFDRIAAILERLVELELQLVTRSDGPSPYAALLRRYASVYPRRIRTLEGADRDREGQLLASADLLLVPGMGDDASALALRGLGHGAIPILARTPGTPSFLLAADHLLPRDPAFGFEPCDPASLLAAIRSALIARADRLRWRRLVARARSAPARAARAAAGLEELYRRALARAASHPAGAPLNAHAANS